MVIGMMFLWLYIIGFLASIAPLSGMAQRYAWFMYERENRDGYRRYKPEAAPVVLIGVGLALVWPISYLCMWTIFQITAQERAELRDQKAEELRAKAQQTIREDEERQRAEIQKALEPPASTMKKVVDAGAGFFLPPSKRKSQ